MKEQAAFHASILLAVGVLDCSLSGASRDVFQDIFRKAAQMCQGGTHTAVSHD